MSALVREFPLVLLALLAIVSLVVRRSMWKPDTRARLAILSLSAASLLLSAIAFLALNR